VKKIKKNLPPQPRKNLAAKRSSSIFILVKELVLSYRFESQGNRKSGVMGVGRGVAAFRPHGHAHLYLPG
jgi:hypothetical protein